MIVLVPVSLAADLADVALDQLAAGWRRRGVVSTTASAAPRASRRRSACRSARAWTLGGSRSVAARARSGGDVGLGLGGDVHAELVRRLAGLVDDAGGLGVGVGEGGLDAGPARPRRPRGRRRPRRARWRCARSGCFRPSTTGLRANLTSRKATIRKAIVPQMTSLMSPGEPRCRSGPRLRVSSGAVRSSRRPPADSAGSRRRG